MTLCINSIYPSINCTRGPRAIQMYIWSITHITSISHSYYITPHLRGHPHIYTLVDMAFNDRTEVRSWLCASLRSWVSFLRLTSHPPPTSYLPYFLSTMDPSMPLSLHTMGPLVPCACVLLFICRFMSILLPSSTSFFRWVLCRSHLVLLVFDWINPV